MPGGQLRVLDDSQIIPDDRDWGSGPVISAPAILCGRFARNIAIIRIGSQSGLSHA